FREVRLEDIQVAVQVYVTNATPHAGLLHSILAERGSAGQADFRERPVFIVAEQQAGSGVARHVDIRPTCIVKVGRDRGHTVTARSLADSRGIAYIFECPVAIVAIQIAAPQRKAARAAIYRNSFPIA